MHISMLWSRSFLLHKRMLWLLLWVNGLGTIYGYEWYRAQLVRTFHNEPTWLLPFVPDSPTASLFFTLAIAYLLRDHYRRSQRHSVLRHMIEALAVVTSIKYGIWAVAMIALGTAQGDPFYWQHGMLSVSHIGMVVEAMLFLRFFSFRAIHLLFTALWTLCNDLVDYTFGVYPYLSFPGVQQWLPWIKLFTIGLSVFSVAYAFIFRKSQ